MRNTGLPQFRGLWTNNMPVDFQSFISCSEMRAEAWRRKFALEDAFRNARPGRGHRAIAHLATIGKASHVITQNIDNLHQLSGVPDEQVIELHGNGSYAHCLDCGSRHEIDEIRPVFEAEGAPPDCRDCGGLVKTATISFGQAMPAEAMARAEEATLACDLFLAIGSSLVVFPAAGFPMLAKRNGACLVIINRDPTELDDIADHVIRADIGGVLEPLTMLNG
jgi:NAD-dependent deacetylase